ncbi:hypothetical protein EDD15DRAFT_1406480 [Pisolithus albus]|nr:hypothetical protein EDD15DRAFT_1406480 [Pisolithus albus]
MALDKRIVFKKSPKCLKLLLFMLGMAPEPPKISGLFSETKTCQFFSIDLLRHVLRNDPATSDCLVVKAGWYKWKSEGRTDWTSYFMGGVSHDFLRFDILSPDKVHTSILIAERFRGKRHSDGTESTYIDAPLDTSRDVAGDSTTISADESEPRVDEVAKASGKTKQEARPSVYRIGNDRASWATMGSRAGVFMEWKHRKATCIRTLTFPESTRVSANQVMALLEVASKHKRTYSVTDADDWFVETVFEALKHLFAVVEKNTAGRWGRPWNNVPIPPKGSVNEEVCTKYRAALEEEAKEKRQHEEEEERRRKERQAREEATRRYRERTREIEEETKRERERRHAAEERIRAIEEEARREHEKTREEIAKLRREVEAARAGQVLDREHDWWRKQPRSCCDGWGH